MRRRWILIAIATLLAAATAMAQPRAQHPGRQKALAEYLQLTPDQVSTWQQVGKETAAAVQPLAANARDLRSRLRDALQAASPDQAAVGALTVQLDAVRKQIHAAREEGKAKRLAVLTPEQKAKLEAFRAARGFARRGRERR